MKTLLWIVLLVPSLALGQTADEIRATADKAIAEGKYEDAFSALKELEKTAARLKSASLKAEAKDRMKALEDLREEAKAAVTAELKLSTGPDPEASLVAGRFTAFVRGNWDVGLKMLLVGSDPRLKTLADLDLNKVEQVKVAEGWLTEARRYPLGRQQLEERATALFRQAWSESAGIEREKLRMKLKAIAGMPERPARGSASSTGWNFQPSTCADDGFAKAGRRSLRMLPAKDNWAGAATEKTAAAKEYKVSAWFFSNGSDGRVEVCVRYWAIDGKYLGQVGPSLSGDCPIWTELDATVQPSPNVAMVDFVVSFVGKAGAVWIDEVSIKADGKELVTNGGFER